MTDWWLNFFTDSESKACSPNEGPQPAQSEPSTAEQETPTSEGVQPASPLASGTDQATQDELLPSDAHPDDTGTSWRPSGLSTPHQRLGQSPHCQAWVPQFCHPQPRGWET